MFMVQVVHEVHNSIILLTVIQSFAARAFFSSAITQASVSDRKLPKSSFNAGHDSRIVYFVSAIYSLTYHSRRRHQMAIWGEKVYVPAIMGASGITKEQAKTCFYYSIATFLLPEKINRFPLLMIMGPQGTGKSELLTQMGKMVNEPKNISAQTKAALRDKLHNTITSLIDEGGEIDEDLLIRRYDVETGTISYNKNYGGSAWFRKRANIFGATIIV
jgi:hypothetical protein